MTPIGSRDGSFGNSGVAYVSFGANSFSFAQGVAIAPEGGFIVVGQTGSPSKIAIAKFDATGVIDSSFGTDGKLTTHVPGSLSSVATDVLVQPDGRIVVGALATIPGAPPLLIPTQASVVLRYLPDGTLDPSFDAEGILIVSTAVGGMSDLAWQTDGKLLASSAGVGPTGSDASIAAWEHELSDSSVDVPRSATRIRRSGQRRS